MFNILLMISNYFHDLSVAVLATNLLAIYFLGKMIDREKLQYPVIAKLFVKLSRVTYFALGYIVVGGAIRAYYFYDFEWSPAVGKGLVAALVVKHILLVSITAVGLFYQIRYKKKYGDR